MDDPFLEKVQMQVLDFATDKRTQWESKHHQQVHLDQPHMVQLRSFKSDYIVNTVLGEVELKG